MSARYKIFFGSMAPPLVAGAPVLDLDFTVAGDYTPYLSCTRAAGAYAKDSTGADVYFGPNVLRITDLGLFVEAGVETVTCIGALDTLLQTRPHSVVLECHAATYTGGFWYILSGASGYTYLHLGGALTNCGTYNGFANLTATIGSGLDGADIIKIGFSQDLSGRSVVGAGGTVLSDAGTNALATTDVGFTNWVGFIRSIAVWDSRLADEDLRVLTLPVAEVYSRGATFAAVGAVATAGTLTRAPILRSTAFAATASMSSARVRVIPRIVAVTAAGSLTSGGSVAGAPIGRTTAFSAIGTVTSSAIVKVPITRTTASVAAGAMSSARVHIVPRLTGFVAAGAVTSIRTRIVSRTIGVVAAATVVSSATKTTAKLRSTAFAAVGAISAAWHFGVFQRSVFQHNVFQITWRISDYQRASAFVGTGSMSAQYLKIVYTYAAFEATGTMTSGAIFQFRRNAGYEQSSRMTSYAWHEPAHLKYRPGQVVQLRTLRSDYGWRVGRARAQGVLKNRKFG